MKLPHLPSACFQCKRIKIETANEAEQNPLPPRCGNNSSSPANLNVNLSNRKNVEI